MYTTRTRIRENQDLFKKKLTNNQDFTILPRLSLKRVENQDKNC